MDAAEPFNVPVNPVALGIPVSAVSLWICIALLWNLAIYVSDLVIYEYQFMREIWELGNLSSHLFEMWGF